MDPPPQREYHREHPLPPPRDSYHREPRDSYREGPPRDYPPPPSRDPYHHHGSSGHREDHGLPPPSRSSHHYHRDPYDDPYHDPHRERDAPPARLPPPSARSLPYKILCVANLNSKVSDSSIRDALIHEFARFGEVSVKIIHDSNERFAYLYFRCYEDAREARHAKYRLVLFDKPVEIDPIYEKIPPPPPPPPQRVDGPYRSGSRRSLTPPDYHHSRSRSPSYRSRPLPPPSSSHHLPPPPSTGAPRVDRHGNPYPVRSSYGPRDDRDRYPSDYPPSRDPYDRPSGSSRDPYDRSLSSSSSRLPSSPNPGSKVPGSATTRENKKDKFPNYLHHVAPEEDVNATRTLFVGNLEVSISDPELRRIFEKFGVVEDIDVKRPPPGQGNAYAFIKFLNLDMAHRAKVEMSGQYIGKFQCKIGYGKATPTTRIWVGGLGSWTSLTTLEHEFDRFGAIRKIDFVKGDNHAYILFDSIDAATAAIQEMRGFPLGGQDKRLRVDFADPGVYSGEPGQEPIDGDSATIQAGSATAILSTPSQDGVPKSPAAENGRTNSPNGSMDSRRRVNDDGADEASESKRPRIVSPDGEVSNDSGVVNTTPLIKTELISFDDCPQFEDVDTIQDLIKSTKVVWTGGLKLKNSSFPCQMHHCSGDPTMVDMFMGDQSGLVCNGTDVGQDVVKEEVPDSVEESKSDLINQPKKDFLPLIKVTQRLRLDPAKLEDVSKRIKLAGSKKCLLLVSSAPQEVHSKIPLEVVGESEKLSLRQLKNLISYFKARESAGVANLTLNSVHGGNSGSSTNNDSESGQQQQGSNNGDVTAVSNGENVSKVVMYCFPTCDYSIELIKKIAPNFNASVNNSSNPIEEFLLVLLVKG